MFVHREVHSTRRVQKFPSGRWGAHRAPLCLIGSFKGAQIVGAAGGRASGGVAGCVGGDKREGDLHIHS